MLALSMERVLRVSSYFFALGALTSGTITVRAVTVSTRFSFNTANGLYPGQLVFHDGNLYGTTDSGGPYGYGTVFEYNLQDGNLVTLASFNGTDGASPNSLVFGPDGNLYGTTVYGGADYGTIFEINHNSGSLTSLAVFGGNNGANPTGTLTTGPNGAFYGLTREGGTTWYGADSGDGTVFECRPGEPGLTSLASFVGSNGMGPQGSLVAHGGYFYGVAAGYGDGNVFKLNPSTDQLEIAASFDGADGDRPLAGLVDYNGTLYGTTQYGGTSSDGNVFKFDPSTDAITTLVSFSGGITGNQPEAPLIADANGDLFGTTSDGTAFEVTTRNGGSTLWDSTLYGATNGGLVADTAGNLYGTSEIGGSGGSGSIFELSNTGFAVPEPSGLDLLTLSGLLLGFSAARYRLVPNNTNGRSKKTASERGRTAAPVTANR